MKFASSSSLDGVVKTAMVFDFTSGSGRQQFLTAEERRGMVFDSHIPIHVSVLTATCELPSLHEFRAQGWDTVAQVARGEERFPFHFQTVVLGRLLLHVAANRVRPPAPWRFRRSTLYKQVWPSRGPGLQWPPLIPMNLDQVEEMGTGGYMGTRGHSL